MHIGYLPASLLLLFLAPLPGNTMHAQNEPPPDSGSTRFPPIDMKNWKNIPHIQGRVATEADIESCRAVFFVPDGESKPYAITLPACAIFHDDEAREDVPVVIIQVEETDVTVLVGYLQLDGQDGVCALHEVEILSAPDKRFYK